MEKDLYMLELSIYDKKLYVPTFIRFTYQNPPFGELYYRFARVFVDLNLSNDDHAKLSYGIINSDKEELEDKIPKFLENHYYLKCPSIARVFIDFLYHLKVSLEWSKEYNFESLYRVLQKVKVCYTKIEDSDFI